LVGQARGGATFFVEKIMGKQENSKYRPLAGMIQHVLYLTLSGRQQESMNTQAVMLRLVAVSTAACSNLPIERGKVLKLRPASADNCSESSGLVAGAA